MIKEGDNMNFEKYGYTKDELLDALSDAMNALEDSHNQGLDFLDDFTSVDERLDTIWTIIKDLGE